MNILLVAVGSRGDAEPFIALAYKLLTSGHNVYLFLQTDLIWMCPKEPSQLSTSSSSLSSSSSPSPSLSRDQGDLKIYPLPFEQNDFYKFVQNPSHGADHENPRVRFTGIVADVIAELVLPCCENVINIAQTNNIHALITSELARSLCFAVSQKLLIPTYLVHLQALVPTVAFPHYSQIDNSNINCLNSISNDSDMNSTNLNSYWELENYQYDFLKERLDSMYTKMGLNPLTYQELQRMLIGKHQFVFIMNAFSKHLIPDIRSLDTDIGPNVYHVGALADMYIPNDFVPPDTSTNENGSDLKSFLLQEPRPLCIGFGSMPFHNVTMILDFLKKNKLRAVLVGTALQLPNDSEAIKSNNVYQIDSIPYPWILPYCQMMICHGGAGVVHATLRAGIPCVIAPFFGDQFFHADLMKLRGLGNRAGYSNLTSLTMQDLKDGVDEAKECINATKAIRNQMEKERSGLESFLHIFENHCSQHQNLEWPN